jgi:hypothetical protein
VFNRPKGNTRTYADERQRLLLKAAELEPVSDEYHKVMTRIDLLDKITKRSSDLVKTIIPAGATVAGLVGIYAIQQFAGVAVPKAMDMLVGRRNKSSDEQD